MKLKVGDMVLIDESCSLNKNDRNVTYQSLKALSPPFKVISGFQVGGIVTVQDRLGAKASTFPERLKKANQWTIEVKK